MTQRLILRHGDCVEVLSGYEGGSVSSIICDPPYGLRFMNKEFDDLGEGASQRKWHEAWLEQAYRVLRPGGVIKAFSGTRTFHHMAYAFVQAGFVDLRLESWNYGSGFPKSHNIGKALDKAAGAEREVVGWNETARIAAGSNQRRHEQGTRPSEYYQGTGCAITAPATEAAHQWSQWGTALKPSWEPVVVGRKPE